MFRKVILAVSVCLLIASAAVAQTPSIFAGGIVSAASLTPAGAPGYAVAPGSIVSIFGNNLATATASAAAIPLPTTLGNASVTIGGATAPLFFVSAGQINAQVPYTVGTGNQPVVVTRSGTASAAVNVPVTATAPGIFTAGQDGHGPGAVQNFVANGNTPTNGFNISARIGQVIVVYATGGGAVQGGLTAGAACGGQQFTGTATATIGGRNAAIAYAGCTPSYAGLDQYNLTVPAGTPDGCFVPLQVGVNGVLSNIVTIAVAASGDCNTANTGSPGGLPNQSIGTGSLVRTSISLATPIGNFSTSVSAFAGNFIRYGAAGQTGSGSSIPPAGAGCLVEVYRGTGPTQGASATFLDAGTLTLTAPSGTYVMTRNATTGSYVTSGNSVQPGGLNITTGQYSLRGSGGADVGAFGPATMNLSTLFNVTNVGYAGGALSQSSSLTSTWTCPDPNGQVYALLTSTNSTTGLYGQAYCTALCSAGTITIPSSVLRQLPVSSADSFSYFLIFSPSAASVIRFTASGLNAGGYFLYADGTGNTGTLNP